MAIRSPTWGTWGVQGRGFAEWADGASRGVRSYHVIAAGWRAAHSSRGVGMDEPASPAEVRAQARGELAAVQYAIKPEDRPACNCPGKHGLVQFTADRSFGCDLCGKRFPTGSVMRGCRSCDYDVCSVCASASIGASTAEEPGRTKQRQQLVRSSRSYDELLAEAAKKAKQRKDELEHVNSLRQQAAERAEQELAQHNRRGRP